MSDIYIACAIECASKMPAMLISVHECRVELVL